MHSMPLVLPFSLLLGLETKLFNNGCEIPKIEMNKFFKCKRRTPVNCYIGYNQTIMQYSRIKSKDVLQWLFLEPGREGDYDN